MRSPPRRTTNNTLTNENLYLLSRLHFHYLVHHLIFVEDLEDHIRYQAPKTTNFTKRVIRVSSFLAFRFLSLFQTCCTATVWIGLDTTAQFTIRNGRGRFVGVPGSDRKPLVLSTYLDAQEHLPYADDSNAVTPMSEENGAIIVPVYYANLGTL